MHRCPSGTRFALPTQFQPTHWLRTPPPNSPTTDRAVTRCAPSALTKASGFRKTRASPRRFSSFSNFRQLRIVFSCVFLISAELENLSFQCFQSGKRLPFQQFQARTAAGTEKCNVRRTTALFHRLHAVAAADNGCAFARRQRLRNAE